MRAILPYFFITVRRNNLENISLIEVWNHRVFVNRRTPDYKYRVPDCETLPLPIQIMFSSKQKTFSRFFIPFTESRSNLKYFPKNEDRHS